MSTVHLKVCCRTGSRDMELPCFDPFDHAEANGTTAAWLTAFGHLAPHEAWLTDTIAGVLEFEYGEGDEQWLAALKAKEDTVLATADTDDFEEVPDKDAFATLLATFFHKTQAYDTVLLTEDVARAWASSFANSMEGARFMRSTGGIVDHTFESCFVAVIGNKLAYVLIVDED